MDYEKAYKEALERAKSFEDKFGGGYAGHIFPELRESEDERMKRAIVHILYENYSDAAVIEGVEIAEIVAWLDKQKESSHISETCKENAEPFTDEQQPAEWSEEDIKKIRPEEYTKGFNDAAFGSKQEWSDEDGKKLTAVISLIRTSRAVDPFYDKMYLESWLKSLRPQKNCSDCAKNIEGYIHGRSDAENKLLEQFGAIITPEGELRMKPHWKPSEVQMSMLLAVINEPNNAGAESCHIALKSLYEQLKKI